MQEEFEKHNIVSKLRSHPTCSGKQVTIAACLKPIKASKEVIIIHTGLGRQKTSCELRYPAPRMEPHTIWMSCDRSAENFIRHQTDSALDCYKLSIKVYYY